MKHITFCILTSLLLLCSCDGHQNEYDASGIFETTEVIVSAQAVGEIMSLQLEEGTQVSALQPLGYIDTVQLTLQRRQLEAVLLSTDSRRLDSDSQLATLHRQIAHAEKEKARFEALVAADAAPQKQLDDINSQLQMLQGQLAASSEQIGKSNSSLQSQSASVEAQIALVDEQLRKCIVRSPIDGIVLAKYAERGEYTAHGKPLFKVGDVRHMKLRAYLTGDQLTRIRLGQQVTVYADEGKKERKAYEGTVSWISPKAEFTPKTIQTRNERANLVYAVKISVINDGYIKQGMYGDVKF